MTMRICRGQKRNMTETDFVLMLQDHQGEDRAELGG
jgi:hypothetical protein